MPNTGSLAALALAALIPLAAGCSRSPAASLTPLPADSLSTPLAVRPGDVVKIQVWEHPELTGEFPVDENFHLVFPILGEINVREMTLAQLRTRIRQELSQLFTQPFVTIVPLFRVAVLGEVVKPGLYSVDPTVTVFDLLALAGGPLRSAKESDMRLIRAGSQIQVSVQPTAIANATLRELGIRSGDQLIVPRSAITREDVGLLVTLANFVLVVYQIFRR